MERGNLRKPVPNRAGLISPIKLSAAEKRPRQMDNVDSLTAMFAQQRNTKSLRHATRKMSPRKYRRAH
jgi:hypothetical protein